MNKKLQVLKYIFLDIVSAVLVWAIFFVYRKRYLEPIKFGHEVPLNFDDNFYLGLALIPLFWIIIYFIVGTYNDIYRKSRLIEFGQTLSDSQHTYPE